MLLDEVEPFEEGPFCASIRRQERLEVGRRSVWCRQGLLQSGEGHALDERLVDGVVAATDAAVDEA